MATSVKTENQPAGLSIPAFGSVQTTGDRDKFVGWGKAPFISEFSPSGGLLFNAEFSPGVFTYRACLLPWHPGRLHRTGVSQGMPGIPVSPSAVRPWTPPAAGQGNYSPGGRYRWHSSASTGGIS